MSCLDKGWNRSGLERAGITIPDNAGRHTFISMQVARYESIDKKALEADNRSIGRSVQ
jgi:hypothetical protein